MPRQPQRSLNLKLNLRLEHARRDQRGYRRRPDPHLLAGGAHPLQLPRALDRAHPAQRGRAVAQLEAFQPPGVAEVAGGGQHVQLQADAAAGAEPRRLQRGHQLRERGQGLDRVQRRFGPGPLQRAPHQQPWRARHRQQQVGLLVGARQVGEVGALHDQRRVQPVRGQLAAQRAVPSLDLVARDHGGYDSRPCPPICSSPTASSTPSTPPAAWPARWPCRSAGSRRSARTASSRGCAGRAREWSTCRAGCCCPAFRTRTPIPAGAAWTCCSAPCSTFTAPRPRRRRSRRLPRSIPIASGSRAAAGRRPSTARLPHS